MVLRADHVFGARIGYLNRQDKSGKVATRNGRLELASVIYAKRGIIYPQKLPEQAALGCSGAPALANRASDNIPNAHAL
jgi:hypothetical protein